LKFSSNINSRENQELVDFLVHPETANPENLKLKLSGNLKLRNSRSESDQEIIHLTKDSNPAKSFTDLEEHEDNSSLQFKSILSESPISGRMRKNVAKKTSTTGSKKRTKTSSKNKSAGSSPVGVRAPPKGRSSGLYYKEMHEYGIKLEENFKNQPLHDFLQDPIAYQYYYEYLEEIFSVEHLNFWTEVEKLNQMDGSLEEPIVEIYKRFFELESAEPINITNDLLADVKKEIYNQNWDKSIYLKCQKWVLKLLTSNSINFPQSPFFDKYIEHKYLTDQNSSNKNKTNKKPLRKFTGKNNHKKEKSSRLRKV